MEIGIQEWKNKGKFFEFNGHKIFYVQDGKGPVLTLIHGYPYNSLDWKYIWNDLIKKYTVVAPDLLGMGFSDKPKSYSYSFSDHASMINALLKSLNVFETQIIAHDLGVSVGQELLALAKEDKNQFQINSMAFMNGGLFTDVYKPRMIQKILSDSPAFIGKTISKLISKRMVAKSTNEVFGPNSKPTQQQHNEFWEILNYNDGKAISYLIGRLLFDRDKFQKRWINAMQTINIPICYINGPYDPNSGLHMVKRYKELMPNPKVYLLKENIGHWPQIEDPQGVLDAYAEFLS